jgi:FMN phosphatase YigB (HAD superfamily)
VREALAEQSGADFMRLQYSETARRHGCPPEQVEALVSEWMETAPLPLLAACRYDGLPQLFAALRAAGKRIGILSDYPAVAKLAAMELDADIVVSACDPDIGCLKPDPHGLLTLLKRAGVPAERAVMIGDRFERDAEVAHRAGVLPLVRSSSKRQGVLTFRRFDDPLFQPLLAPAAVPAAA